MTPSDLKLPSKACHNCRRRRWKCDRSLPVCQKCSSSGTECLGYGKLLIWEHGVSSRGKMMGKSYKERPFPKKEKPKTHSALPSRNKPSTTRNDFSGETESNSTSSDSTSDSSLEPMNSSGPTVRWPLTDPLVADMRPQSRYYIFHFATQLCADFVAYDGPDRNPMRNLIPSISSSPLLLHIIVATSALHISNISKGFSDTRSTERYGKIAGVDDPKPLSRYSGPHHSSYCDALAAKQQALLMLSKNIPIVNEYNLDIPLATILLFIHYALIESGKDGWKVHMEGARKLIEMLSTPSYQPQVMSNLRTYLVSEFLV